VSNLINKRLKELRSLDASEKIRNLPRREWNSRNEILLWQIKPRTEKKIFNLARKHKPKIILELGTSAGFSTLILRKAVPEALIHTVECVPYRLALAKESFFKTKTKNVVLHEDKILNVLRNWSLKGVDFVFLDADKEHYELYIKLILPFLSKNAVIVADNILDNPSKTKKFIDFMMALKNFKTKIFKLDNGVLVSERIK
jgi:predicted O-methyltransferase YrrM